ncbi:Curli production assembly/transport component [Pseudoalteromonas sp. 3J6]|jgi:curli production assembly/transport component CsgE|uniref:curli production assembly/transport protein CsgE n=1 Tax=unclassified Pseudoalteromonas TaxID=194690 RepID=UPI0015BCF283|nr:MULTISPECIES: curli production assembly/transport protein CsgE [unclassified Pseudoalteromonas]MDN3485580.1 curli production assembly/transport protein CsgE [Pseudoalteromonas sp. APC 3224]NWL17613.1 curli production assembly protein CsgE [Pseudoalteromonas sp. Scap03]QLE83037.1 curli production assembly protein CsgE [Pseudoalteromonas sp. Scap25]QLE90979.1 curli production assembly protein CsgE [Pseudoalteromonas sp. Scap06]CAD2223923.1 Curli production assembly/transport component [Pseudo|tara:strand:- start:78 stop:470 length:393 start_codon:yes stop_codon:yes gene_type:complete
MKNNKYNYFFILLTLFIPCSNASDDLEIDGLLLNKSISRFGYQFYSEFSNYWREFPSTAGFNVEIKETVIPRAGTKLVLIMNNKIIYATHLGRKLEPLDERVEQAVHSVMDAMARSNMQTASPDMALNGW